MIQFPSLLASNPGQIPFVILSINLTGYRWYSHKKACSQAQEATWETRVGTRRSKNNRDVKMQRRGRRRERQKKKVGLISKITTSHVYHTFLYIFFPFCTTTTWKCLISRFMEDVNNQRRNFISLSELEFGPLKFSFRRVRLQSTK